LKSTTTALQEREQRLRLALDAAKAGSWTRDLRTDSVYRDDRFRQMYGFEPGEPISFEAWLSRVHEEDRPQVLKLWKQMLHSQSLDTFDTTFRILLPDGTVSWIQSLGQAQRDASGQLIRLSGLEVDVTERRHSEERDLMLRKQAEDTLRRSHAELEQRTLQLRRLASQLTLTEQNTREQLAKMLHDGLQQSLFSAGMTLDRALKTGSYNNQVDLIRRAQTDLNEAIEAARTLGLSIFPPALHTGGLPLGLAWLARRMQEQYKIIVNLTAAPEADPISPNARILLFEAIRELLFNAVKHAHVDQINVNLTLDPDDVIHIQVSDKGVGFDPILTLQQGSQQQVGLGLFGIQERVGLLGGRLDIASAPGNGARFSLTLPRMALSSTASDVTETPRYDAGWKEGLIHDVAADTSTLRILIVDDHAVVRVGLRNLFGSVSRLELVGEAADGVEAISQAMSLKPDVIVMDVSMPVMDGIEATRAIHRILPHIQIVGLSTYNDESTERLMCEAGAKAYFPKTEGTGRLLKYLLRLLPHTEGASPN
jgi:PAS domain S-box-containing protein